MGGAQHEVEGFGIGFLSQNGFSKSTWKADTHKTKKRSNISRSSRKAGKRDKAQESMTNSLRALINSTISTTGQVHECVFLAGSPSSPRGETASVIHALEPVVWQTRESQATKKLEGAKGMEKVVPISQPPTLATRSLVCHRLRTPAHGAYTYGGLHHGRPQHLRPPIRASPMHDVLTRPSSEVGHGRVDPTSVTRASRTSWKNRRIRPVRQPRLLVLETLVPLSVQPPEEARAHRAVMGFQLRRVRQGLQPCGPKVGRAAVAIPDASLRAQRRSGQRVAHPAGDSEKRRLEKCEIYDALREVRQIGRRLPGPILQDAPARAMVRRTSRGCHPWAKGGSGTAMNKHCTRYFLDFFSGNGGISKGLRALGFRSYEVDVKHGARFDLTDRDVLHKFLVSIQRLEVLGAVFAPPMASFSVAKDRTTVIRNHAYPWGVPVSTMTPADQQRVLFGNACAKSVLRLIRALDRYRLPWCVVHPLGSKLWLLPPFDSLADMPHVHSQVVDCCQLGAQCKRPVLVSFGNLDSQDLERLSPLRCRGSQGVCSRTQKRHKQWSSTSTAPPYPAQLCHHLAYVLAAPYLTTDPSTLWLPSA